MKEVKVISDQNIIDFTIQYTGSSEGLFSILELNSDLGVNSTLKVGDIIVIPDDPTDVNNLKYYEKNDIVVTTGEKEYIGDFNNDFNNDFNL